MFLGAREKKAHVLLQSCQSCCIGVSNCIAVRYLKRKRGSQPITRVLQYIFCKNKEEEAKEIEESREAEEAEGVRDQEDKKESYNFIASILN